MCLLRDFALIIDNFDFCFRSFENYNFTNSIAIRPIWKSIKLHQSLITSSSTLIILWYRLLYLSQIQQLEPSSATSKCKGSVVCVTPYANFIYAMELYIYTNPAAVDILVQADRRYQQLTIYRQQHRHNLRFYRHRPVTVNFTDSRRPSTLRCLHHSRFSWHRRVINFIDHHRLTRRQSICHHHTLSLRLLLLPKISATFSCVHRS